ncbi:hypothetical protein [Peribacillus frigoritolerans]
MSIGLGGGTQIRETNRDVTVGPESVGYEIMKKAFLLEEMF